MKEDLLDTLPASLQCHCWQQRAWALCSIIKGKTPFDFCGNCIITMIVHRWYGQSISAKSASNLQDLGQCLYHLKEIRENRTEQHTIFSLPMPGKKGANFMVLETNALHENGSRRENSRVKNNSPSRIKNRKTNLHAEEKMKIQKRNRKFLGNDTLQSCKMTDIIKYQQLQTESLKGGLFLMYRMLQSLVHFQKVKGLLTVLLFPKHRSNPPDRPGERQISLCISASQNISQLVEMCMWNIHFIIILVATKQNYIPKYRLARWEDLINK